MATKANDTPHVYEAIAAVQGELAKVGIAKTRKNQQPGANYNFRGIDDVYAALSPLLSANKLVVVPRVIERQCETRQTKNGGAIYNVTVHAEFDFVSALDGSKHTAATYGEAMDSSDKATNKAMSAAYKYAAFMTFAIPTEGEDNDADASHHETIVANDRPVELAKREKLEGPHTSKTALWKAVKEFDRTIRGIGDLGELLGFLDTPDSVALIEQCKRDAPGLWSDGLPDLPEFVPLEILIADRKRELTEIDELVTASGIRNVAAG